MDIYDYTTRGGKNVITNYIDKLSAKECGWKFMISGRKYVSTEWMHLKNCTRQLRGKLWEIRVSQTRIMYVIVDTNGVAFLHICKKQKGKAEKQEIEKALERAKRENLI